MFDLNFLARCHSNLFHYMHQLFETKSHCVCFILLSEYHYVWKDWFNGKEYPVSPADAIEHKEKNKIEKIKNNDCKVRL